MTNFLFLFSLILIVFHNFFTYSSPISRVSKTEVRKFSAQLLTSTHVNNINSGEYANSNARHTTTPAGGDESFELRKKLQQVFQLDSAALQRPKPGNPESAPEYMLDLYKQTADTQSGLTKGENPYGANLVRSFNNKGLAGETHFWFDVGKMSRDRGQRQQNGESGLSLKGAEFHVYKHVKKNENHSHEESRTNQFLEMQLSHVVFENAEERWQTIESRVVNSHGSGWEVFHVADTVTEWILNPDHNFGLLITIAGLDGKEVDSSSLGMEIVTQPKSRHRPLLVVFCVDGTKKKQISDYRDSAALLKDVPREAMTPVSRGKRSTDAISEEQIFAEQRNGPITASDLDDIMQLNSDVTTNDVMSDQAPQPDHKWATKKNCERLPLYVDFYEIGWSGWIISPSGYNAFYCQGECPFPLGQMHRPSNHATVQSIVNAIGPKSKDGLKIPQPCCVPDRLYSISLLYFDDSGDVILKQYDDMVAASCGCH